MPGPTISPTQRNSPSGLPCPNSSSSFWHSEPSPFLLQHRTSKELPTHADIVIIGSGITGASAARYLASDPRAASLNIVMLEAREACWGATGRNGGHCQPLLFDRSTDVASFELKNIEAVKSYIEENEVDCEWRQVVGCRTYWDEQLFKAAEQEVKTLHDEMPAMASLVMATRDKKELRKHRVADGAVGATLTKGAGCLWPYKYVTFILEKLVREGKLNLQTNTPVTDISPVKDHTATSSTTASLITTPRGTFTASHVILATNGYTSGLLPSFTDLIVPVRCEMSALHPPTGSERLPSSYGFVAAHGQNPNYDDYLIQRPFYDDVNGIRRGGHLMFGGGRGTAQLQCVGVWEDDVVDQGEAEYLRKGLLDTLDLGGEARDLKELVASHQWTGIKGYSRDNTPWVGPIPPTASSSHQSIWLSGGYTGHGMPNATLCAYSVVQMLLGSAYSGLSIDEVQNSLMAEVRLPKAYLITEERLKEAEIMPSVAWSDVHGLLGNQSVEMLEAAGVVGAGGAKVEKVDKVWDEKVREVIGRGSDAQSGKTERQGWNCNVM